MSANNRKAVYSSVIWRHISPVDRAHIILVAEGEKLGAHCSVIHGNGIQEILERELNIKINDYRGKVEHYPPVRSGIHVPNLVATVAQSKRVLQAFDHAVNKSEKNYQLLEGKFLSYPICCCKEYIHPTYTKKFSKFIIDEVRKSGEPVCTFLLESIEALLQGKYVLKEFELLMPSQTPCSIHCRRTRKLLHRWEHTLRKIDHQAFETITSFNRLANMKVARIAHELEKKGITLEDFYRNIS
jgi:hypothetical protein